ncbi:ABC transporter permease [Rhodanobacter sp. Col0626]|uniref:ABC transporter permease n=1 Tax=Rhodanobacter sp. Col0626 TaxID=3415679 RepID=UPI003CF2B749
MMHILVPTRKGRWWYATAPVLSIARQWSLYRRMVARDLSLRYRGSVLGAVWSMLNPLSLLVVFSFVFGVVLNARWGVMPGANFPLLLFAGLVPFIFLSESITRAPMLILENSNYVKKVVFPLELLPFVVTGSALVNLGIALLILLLGQLWVMGGITYNWIFVPLVMAPLAMLATGVVMFMSSLGVFIRDLAQMTSVITMLLMYMSPILFPISMVPPAYRPFLSLNPLTLPVTQLRQVTLEGRSPDWAALGIYYLVAYTVLVIGFWWFWRTKKGFADVI